MKVLDSSAAIELILATPRGQRVAAVFRDPATAIAAPELLITETLQVLRRLMRSGALTESEAQVAIANLRDLDVIYYGHGSLIDRVWELRDNMSAYDATFTSLAEHLGATLVTADARLSNAPGSSAEVVLIR
ncbi:type II toxin-antitoxin system VapC family toxin [Corynebacterium bouchesdurhonense]|uniref:type II toxin-antitoxin system VapC family toxin n=1 Tax=Corynebacterium bouchesdurhonense TaxID=1720192 RepID=UPI00098FD91D